jgi:energy-coupling factor transporter ATP-binding protein EcfA2
MIILELACFGLRSFRQMTKLALRPGLNVIHGRTGAGKSTLFECLQIVLFGLDPRPLRDGITGAGGSAQAAVTVRLRSGEIHRLVMDFAKETFHILTWDPNGKSFTPAARDTSALDQFWRSECDGLPLETVRTLVAWSPRSTFTPGGDAAPDFTGGIPVPARALTSEERSARVQRLAELNTRLAEAERSERADDERAEAAAKEAELRSRLAALNALRARREASAERQDEMTPFLQVPKDLDAQLEGYVKAIPALHEERTGLEEETGALALEIEGLAAPSLLKTPIFLAGAGLTALSFLAGAIITLTGWMQHLYLIGLVGGLGFLIASLALDFRRLSQKKSLEARRDELVTKASHLEDRLKKSYAAPIALMTRTKCSDPETLQARRRAALDWAAEQADFDREKKDMLRGATPDAIEADWLAAKARIEALLREVGERVDVESLRDAIGLLTRELEAPAAGGARPTAPSAPSAGVDPLQAHAAEINACLLRLSEDRLEALSARDGAVLVRRRGGSEAPLDALSAGEAHVARVAIAVGAWAARHAGFDFPLLLDDPLSALDPKTRAVLLDTLTRLGAGRQIIVFANEPAPNAPGISQTALAPA